MDETYSISASRIARSYDHRPMLQLVTAVSCIIKSLFRPAEYCQAQEH